MAVCLEFECFENLRVIDMEPSNGEGFEDEGSLGTSIWLSWHSVVTRHRAIQSWKGVYMPCRLSARMDVCDGLSERVMGGRMKLFKVVDGEK